MTDVFGEVQFSQLEISQARVDIEREDEVRIANVWSELGS